MPKRVQPKHMNVQYKGKEKQPSFTETTESERLARLQDCPAGGAVSRLSGGSNSSGEC